MSFSFLHLFLLFSQLFSLLFSPSLLRFLLWLVPAQPSFCEFVRASAADLRPRTCLLRGGSTPSAYSMRRHWPLRQLQLNSRWCAPLVAAIWRLRLAPPFLAV
ncbi:hypothetical protein HDV64DRAFT_247473 [Trichoderma sp. TUCIM 5745]